MANQHMVKILRGKCVRQCVEVSFSAPVMDRVSECKAIFEIGKTNDAAAATVTRSTSPLSIYLRYPVIIHRCICFRASNPVTLMFRLPLKSQQTTIFHCLSTSQSTTSNSTNNCIKTVKKPNWTETQPMVLSEPGKLNSHHRWRQVPNCSSKKHVSRFIGIGNAAVYTVDGDSPPCGDWKIRRCQAQKRNR